MRLLASFETEEQARHLSNYLTVQQIENQVMMEANKTWALWVYAEDDLEKARAIYQEFIFNPKDDKYRKSAKEAQRIMSDLQKKRAPTPHIDVRTQVFYRGLVPHGSMTTVLIALSVIITLMSSFGANDRIVDFFRIASVTHDETMMYWNRTLVEIRSGQIWRLITPIFTHYGLIHLLFNMLWLNDLGNLLEYKRGKLFLTLFILIVATTSNVGQFVYNGPGFGGMSGVVYGLLGYIWMAGKYDLTSQMVLDKRTVTMMIIWYFLCLFGIIPNIANVVHTVGFGIGIAWGFLDTLKYRLRKRKL